MKSRSFLIFVGVLVLTLFAIPAAFATNAWAPDPATRNVPGELIIGFSPKATLAQINSAVSSVGGKVMSKHGAPKARLTRIKLPSTDPSAMQAAMNNLKSNPAFKNVIQYVEPNAVRKTFASQRPGGDVSIFSQSNDQLQWDQWGYYDIDDNWINAPTTTAGVTVAVVDTGVDYNHPDLVGKVTKGYDYVNADSDPMDDCGHGTHVAGIIAAKANNGYGIAGVSWNAKILAIKVLDSQGYGSAYDVALGIYAAANNSSVKIINLSLGGSESTTEDEAVYYAIYTKGKLVVAAAGNSYTDDPTNAYPAALTQVYTGILAVAAHDQTHCNAGYTVSAPFSNYGTWVSISAPGYDILSTVPISVPTPWSLMSGGYIELSGTSMAAPHVSGAAALAWGKYPTYTNFLIASLLKISGSPLAFNNSCWMNDGSNFLRLSVLDFMEPEYFNLCDNKGAIEGFAFDAESGLPLAGAKVTAKAGTTTSNDYVPDYGYLTTFPGGGETSEGYGLFNVLTPYGYNTLTIQKTGYATFSPKGQNGLAETIPVTACYWSYAGNIPVPPAKSTFWVAVTWKYGYTGSYFDLWADFWLSSVFYGTYGFNNGDLNSFPYVKSMWDSYTPFDGTIYDLRNYSEVIRIAKTTSNGEFIFYVDDWWTGANAANWVTSGMTAYLYKGSTLLKTYSPVNALGSSGQYWIICDIVGTTVIDVNTVSNSVY